MLEAMCAVGTTTGESSVCASAHLDAHAPVSKETSRARRRQHSLAESLDLSFLYEKGSS